MDGPHKTSHCKVEIGRPSLAEVKFPEGGHLNSEAAQNLNKPELQASPVAVFMDQYARSMRAEIGSRFAPTLPTR